MKGMRYVVVVSLVLALCSIAAHDVRAQISAQTRGDLPWIVLLGITEGPDPIPQIVYLRVDEIDPDLILVAIMAGRDDRRPDVSDKDGMELVTWSYKEREQDYDLAVSQWNGMFWGPIQIISFVGEDELDPRAYTTGDGVTHLVWWMDGGTETVYLSSGTGSSWGPPEQVTDFGQPGRRPTIAIREDSTLVAYERDAAGGGQEIVLASRNGAAIFSHEVVHAVQRNKSLDVKLHVEQGALWMDWKHSDTQFAYSQFLNGEWAAPALTPWDDPSWAGIQETRETIRQEILYQ